MRKNKKQRKNAIKDVNAIKYVKYIQWVSICMTVGICLYVGLCSMILKVSYATLIAENMTVVCGFIIALASLITFYIAKQIRLDVSSMKNIEGTRCKLILVTLFSFLFFNYISFGLGMATLIKMYRWKNRFSFSGMIQTMKQERQVGICLAYLLVFVFLVVLETMIASLI